MRLSGRSAVMPGDEEAGGLCGNFGNRGKRTLITALEQLMLAVSLIAITGQVSVKCWARMYFRKQLLLVLQGTLCYIQLHLVRAWQRDSHVFSRTLATSASTGRRGPVLN